MRKLLGNKSIPRRKDRQREASPENRRTSGFSLGFSNSQKFEQEAKVVSTDAKLGMSFLRAVERDDREIFDDYIASGHDVNFQDPRTGETALHIAGGSSDKYQIRALVNSGRCDFLIKDSKNRLPSETAFTHSKFRAIWRYLEILEREQAQVQGVDLSKL